MKIVPVDAEIRASPTFEGLRRAWPEVVFHDAISNANWGRLYDERPEFQFALVEDGDVLAEGNSIPVAGAPATWRDALRTGFDAKQPDRLCAVAILIGPEHQRRGLSRLMLDHMRGLAHERGWDLVAPVRPSLKHRYPLIAMERFASWRRADGTLLDPWLRTHERLGAEVLAVAPESMRIEAPVADWERWTGMSFPEDGEYVVDGGLVPVRFENGVGLYVEPNVWMHHPV